MAKREMPEGFDWKAFTPDDSPMTPLDLWESERHQDLTNASVEAGGPAFPFTLPLFDFSSGTKVATGETFDLIAASKDKPVALIFGSYT